MRAALNRADPVTDPARVLARFRFMLVDRADRGVVSEASSGRAPLTLEREEFTWGTFLVFCLAEDMLTLYSCWGIGLTRSKRRELTDVVVVAVLTTDTRGAAAEPGRDPEREMALALALAADARAARCTPKEEDGRENELAIIATD